MSDSEPSQEQASATQAKDIYKEGFSRFVKGDAEGAIERYRAAIAVSDSLAIAWNGLSMALAKLGDLEAAVEAAQKLVELEPDDPLSHTNLSRILMQKGMIPEAEDAKAKATGLQMRGGK